MKIKIADAYNQAEINEPFKVPEKQWASMETTRKRAEKGTGKKFKTKTIKYKEVTRVK
jgi:hypothetical protein